jgi:hypothetical protein
MSLNKILQFDLGAKQLKQMLEMLFKIEKNDMAFYSGSIANVKMLNHRQVIQV